MPLNCSPTIGKGYLVQERSPPQAQLQILVSRWQPSPLPHFVVDHACKGPEKPCDGRQVKCATTHESLCFQFWSFTCDVRPQAGARPNTLGRECCKSLDDSKQRKSQLLFMFSKRTGERRLVSQRDLWHAHARSNDKKSLECLPCDRARRHSF